MHFLFKINIFFVNFKFFTNKCKWTIDNLDVSDFGSARNILASTPILCDSESNIFGGGCGSVQNVPIQAIQAWRPNPSRFKINIFNHSTFIPHVSCNGIVCIKEYDDEHSVILSSSVAVTQIILSLKPYLLKLSQTIASHIHKSWLAFVLMQFLQAHFLLHKRQSQSAAALMTNNVCRKCH